MIFRMLSGRAWHIEMQGTRLSGEMYCTVAFVNEQNLASIHRSIHNENRSLLRSRKPLNGVLNQACFITAPGLAGQ